MKLIALACLGLLAVPALAQETQMKANREFCDIQSKTIVGMATDYQAGKTRKQISARWATGTDAEYLQQLLDLYISGPIEDTPKKKAEAVDLMRRNFVFSCKQMME